MKGKPMEDCWFYIPEAQAEEVAAASLFRGDDVIATFILAGHQHASLTLRMSAIDFAGVYEAIETIPGMKEEHRQALLPWRESWVTVEEHPDQITDGAMYVLRESKEAGERFAKNLHRIFGERVIDGLLAITAEENEGPNTPGDTKLQ